MTGRRPALRAAALLASLPACAGPALEWPGARRGEDPAPSGSARLRAYKEAYYRDLGDRFVGHLGRADFVGVVRNARVLWLGDHHRDRGLHARLLELLRGLHAAGVRAALGLEAVGTADRAAVRGFLGGDLTLGELRARVRRRWPGSWLEGAAVDSAFYREVLRAARAWRWPVFPLEPTPRVPLSARDRVIAARVRAAARAHPDRLIVVVVGHAHLLGEGRLIERVGLPSVAVGARLSTTLRRRRADYPIPADTLFLKSSSGVLFFTAAMPRRPRGPVDAAPSAGRGPRPGSPPPAWGS